MMNAYSDEMDEKVRKNKYALPQNGVNTEHGLPQLRLLNCGSFCVVGNKAGDAGFCGGIFHLPETATV